MAIDITSVIEKVNVAEMSFCKFLAANDTGRTGSNQAGILIPKPASPILFNEYATSDSIMDRMVRITWQNELTTDSRFVYYKSKDEYRITRFGRGFPFFNPENTGSLFVLVKNTEEDYLGYIIDFEYDINLFLDSFGITPAETNKIIDISTCVSNDDRIAKAVSEYTNGLKEFPMTSEMSSAARRIQNDIFNHEEQTISAPDKKLISWTNVEYYLFRGIENALYLERVKKGFDTVEDFIKLSNSVINTRKSRAGKSLEHHLSALFSANRLLFEEQVQTEGKKRPDFVFPSGEAYHDFRFPAEKLIVLAAKTTCKDRWRQVINEADRLKDGTKYLCTLQQGISPTQMEEMEAEKVKLVVPKEYIKTYPADKKASIWTVKQFIDYVKETENL